MKINRSELHATAKQEEKDLKEDFEFDSVRRTHAMYAGLSGVCLGGIFLCLSIEESSYFLIVAVCCYSICLPGFVASYLFNEMQLGRGQRKLLEYRELMYDKRTHSLGILMWGILTAGILFTILQISKFAGALFLLSIVFSFLVFFIYYYWQLLIKVPSNNQINRTENTSAQN